MKSAKLLKKPPMFKRLFKSLSSLGVVLLAFTPLPGSAELSLQEINSLARQTTVIIAPGLTSELVEELENNRNNPLAREDNPDGVWNPGSGVIVARRNNTYYVLSVTHNFKQRYLEKNIPYGIRTWDGQVHEVKDVNDGRKCPFKDQPSLTTLIRFGCYSLRVPGRVAGLDLAILSFVSDNQYQIASLGNPDSLNSTDRVYVSGWPDPEKERDADGNCRGKVARRLRRLAWGPITRLIEPTAGQNGYSLFYMDQVRERNRVMSLTRPGMSGGPVFDANGMLVGIHGRGSAEKGQLASQYCSVSVAQANLSLESEDVFKAVAEAQQYAVPILHTRFSSAQNLKTFVSLWNQIPVDVVFSLQPPSAEVIARALTPIRAASDDESGVVEVTAEEDITGAYEDAEDPVDIYKSFSLANMLRDRPSAGCRFLLLGEPCDRR